MTKLIDNRDRVKILEDEVNKYIERVNDVPLYPIDRYRLIHYCFNLLDIMGYKYDINSKHELVIKNYYQEPDIKSCKELIENNYYELSTASREMAIYNTDFQSILFQFREIIFKFGIKATYRLGGDQLELFEKQ